MARFGEPESFNTRQRSQFTSREFTALLIAVDIRISMDENGAWRDDVFVERLRKSVKYEEVYSDAPMPACRRPVPRSAGISSSSPPEGLIGAWRADARPGFLQRVAANPGGGMTETETHLAKSAETVQIIRASSQETRRQRRSGGVVSPSLAKI